MSSEVLDQMFSKQDFNELEVAGQFNKGFILATKPAKDENGKRDLFIID